jgi:transcriptional regulator with XRE-family HTH domain
VAELAGIGVDWYIRLEQGRSVRPSVTTIDALARALRLGKVEHTHLRTLAQGGDQRPFSRENVPDAIRRIVESLDQPAYVTGRRWDVLIWNAAAAEVLTDFGRTPDKDRNILLYMLTDPDARRLFGVGWTDEAKRMVGQFRVSYDLWSSDPAFVTLLSRLKQGCAEFPRWWRAHDIRNIAAGQKILNHPTRGALRFEYASFQANDDPALKLVVYTPM